MNVHVPLASAYPAMARTVKVCAVMYACVGVCVHPCERVDAGVCFHEFADENMVVCMCLLACVSMNSAGS